MPSNGERCESAGAGGDENKFSSHADSDISGDWRRVDITDRLHSHVEDQQHHSPEQPHPGIEPEKTDRPMPPELKSLLDKAQPQLPPEAMPVIERLDNWQKPQSGPYEGDAQATAAYEARLDEIKRLWQCVDPEGASFLQEWNIELKPMERLQVLLQEQDGKLTGQVLHPNPFVDPSRQDVSLGEHDRIMDTTFEATAIHDSNSVGPWVGMVHENAHLKTMKDEHGGNQRVLFVDVKLSPAESIFYCEEIRQQLENIHLYGQKTAPTEMSYAGMSRIIEINRQLAEYGMPEHHNEAEKVYREAFEEAIIKAYYTGEIDSHTPHEGLVNIGIEAGRAKLKDLVDSEAPAGERHFLSVFPGRLYTEVKVARDVLNLPQIEVGDEQHTNWIQQWGKQNPGAEQLWIYTRLSNEQTWPTLPKYMQLEDGSFFSPTHTMTAGGKITDLGGE
ncbi:MAG: hypothetical protein J2P36_35695, partial [Ktedonobacteraceae bacterium]|nr:hypothetical protein [Ktedonobacteraceae bacterium]